MKINIIRAANLDENIFNRLKNVLIPFSKPIEFTFLNGSFNEPELFWKRTELNNEIQKFRQIANISNDEFVIFLTTKRDEENWFSACLREWNKNIFVGTIEWLNDNIIDIDKKEYPIAYQIIENLYQYLTSSNFDDYCRNSHDPAIGCINDMCSYKPEIIFKLRTADICKDCQKLAEQKIDADIYDQIIEILENIRFQFLHNKRNFTIFQRSINKIKAENLREIRKFLLENLDKNETVIQDWIDEENGKYRKQRCLIFGIEYIDPKREGEIHMRKRFDVLAEQNLDNHVIIELKSPNAKIFDIKIHTNANGGQTTEYAISSDLARAIPQILQYKRWYESISNEQIQSLGIKNKKSVSECIVVIGQRVDNDEVWKQNFKDLQKHIDVKILTYNDLLDKMNNTIVNIENLIM